MRGTPSLALLAMRCGVSEYKCSPRRNENDDYGSIRVRPGAGAAAAVAHDASFAFQIMRPPGAARHYAAAGRARQSRGK